jgi:predicted lipid-binding transport protein (Tim44 family)
MIVTNFENGNTKELKPLLEDSVFTSFSDVIEKRKQNGEQVEFSFIGIESAEIIYKDLNSSPMEVTVRFISEMITCIKNNKDEIVSGSLNQVQKITDVWTFAKYKNKKTNNWLLLATSAE